MWINEPEVKIISDSQYGSLPRLTTFEIKYWRPILAEFNTHRCFSRNAASSRAQSFQRRAEDIAVAPFVPTHWNAEKPGMVGGNEFSKEIKEYINNSIQELAIKTSEHLLKLNQEVEEKTGEKIHKQYLNRYLEPFTMVTQLITATDWDNFFKLRLAPDAQPEINDVAWQMQSLLDTSYPEEEKIHLPYITESEKKKYQKETLYQISVARCARVSYKAYTGETDLERDMMLFKRLKESGHWSPFEHIAFADPESRHKDQWRNYRGWRQYRAIFD